MLKTGLTALIGVFIISTGAEAQVYVKNTGNVGIGVTNPSAKLELPNNASASFRVGITSNMANTHTQLINSLAVIADERSSLSSCGAVAYDFYNNGNSPSWSGTLLQHFGIGAGGSQYYLPATNLGVMLFQNVANGVLASNGAPIHISPFNGTSTIPVASFLSNGNVGIGTTTPAQKLHVVGTVKADNFITSTGYNYADYVFDSTYQLPTLKEVESYIKQNHHLPEVPSEADVKKDGINLGQHQVVLLKKVEELTLYAIEQNKKQQEQNEKLQLLEEKLTEVLEDNKKLKEELKDVKGKTPRRK